MDEPPVTAPPEPDAGPSVASSLDPGDIPEIAHYELDGIPLFHIPTPGATILTLAFGVGAAHEPAIHRGMTHLFEHLVLTSIDNALDHSNGTTEPFRVTFVTRGSPSHASKFLRDVCAQIESPRLSRMHQEAKVLRTEAAGRGSGSFPMRMTWMRTGYQGIGLSSLSELFLHVMDEKILRKWVERHFVTGNAAIWIAGELPDDLVVLLPPGPRPEPPPVRWIEGLDTPTLVVDDVPGVGASFYAERSIAVAAGFRALNRQLTKRIRVDRGLGYEVGYDRQPVSRDHALSAVWVTCLPDAMRDVQQTVLELIDDVANRGPSDDELSRDFQEFPRDFGDPAAIPARLDAHVRDVLLGEDPAPRTVASQIEERWRLESGHVAAAFKDVRDSMLFVLPKAGGVNPQRPFKPYPPPPTDKVGADQVFEYAVKQKRGLFKKTPPAPRLAVGRGGVAIDSSRGKRISVVRWVDCVAIVRDKDVRSLVGTDGTFLSIYRREWRDGGTALGLIDRFGPKELVVRADK